jgi:hypothetical protein
VTESLVECVTLALLWISLLQSLRVTLTCIFSFENTWKSELQTNGPVDRINALFVVIVFCVALILLC